MTNKHKPVRLALIGCGRVSSRHVDAIMKKVADARLVAVCDVVAERAERYAREIGATPFITTREMYEYGEFDIVDIATPSGDHHERVMEALSHSKHVVVEKPIALRLEHVDEMMAEAERRQRLLWVAFQNRYNPAVQKAREAVVSGRLGKPVLATVRVRWCREQEYYEQDDWHGTWAMDGGVVSQQAIHHVDALRWTMGEVDSVEASCATRLANMECEDLCVASLRFKSGALGVIEATTAVRPRDIEASLSLIGENGTIVLGGLAMNNIDFWEFSEPIPEDEAVPMLFSQEVPTAYGFGHDILFQRVVATVMDGTRAEISGSEARKALEILHAIYASCESGERVLLKDQPTSSRLGISTTGS